MTLETITETRSKGDICISHYKAMLNKVISDSEIRCRNCEGYETSCMNYRPSRNYYVVLSKGRPALMFR